MTQERAGELELADLFCMYGVRTVAGPNYRIFKEGVEAASSGLGGALCVCIHGLQFTEYAVRFFLWNVIIFVVHYWTTSAKRRIWRRWGRMGCIGGLGLATKKGSLRGYVFCTEYFVLCTRYSVQSTEYVQGHLSFAGKSLHHLLHTFELWTLDSIHLIGTLPLPH